MRYSNLVEHLHEVHIGGLVESLVILNSLTAQLVLEMQEEGCWNIRIGATLV